MNKILLTIVFFSSLTLIFIRWQKSESLVREDTQQTIFLSVGDSFFQQKMESFYTKNVKFYGVPFAGDQLFLVKNLETKNQLEKKRPLYLDRAEEFFQRLASLKVVKTLIRKKILEKDDMNNEMDNGEFPSFMTLTDPSSFLGAWEKPEKVQLSSEAPSPELAQKWWIPIWGDGLRLIDLPFFVIKEKSVPHFYFIGKKIPLDSGLYLIEVKGDLLTVFHVTPEYLPGEFYSKDDKFKETLYKKLQDFLLGDLNYWESPHLERLPGFSSPIKLGKNKWTVKQDLQSLPSSFISFTEQEVNLSERFYGISKPLYQAFSSYFSRPRLKWHDLQPEKIWNYGHQSLISSLQKNKIHFVDSTKHNGLVEDNLREGMVKWDLIFNHRDIISFFCESDQDCQVIYYQKDDKKKQAQVYFRAQITENLSSLYNSWSSPLLLYWINPLFFSLNQSDFSQTEVLQLLKDESHLNIKVFGSQNDLLLEKKMYWSQIMEEYPSLQALHQAPWKVSFLSQSSSQNLQEILGEKEMEISFLSATGSASANRPWISLYHKAGQLIFLDSQGHLFQYLVQVSKNY